MTIGNGPISFNLAKAYGLQAAVKPQPVQPVAKSQAVSSAALPASSATSPASSATSAATSVRRADSLAAATVPGKVSFDAAPAATRPEAFSPLQMYSRPSDRNAVATAVAVGRTLDIQG